MGIASWVLSELGMLFLFFVFLIISIGTQQKMPDEDLMKVLSSEEFPIKPTTSGNVLMSLLAEKRTAEEKVVDHYNNVDIVDSGKELLIYKVNLPHLTTADRGIIDSIQRVATKIIDMRKESSDARRRKDSIKRQIEDMIAKSSSIKASKAKMDAYADIVSREMGGYGLIDYLLDDEDLEEVMIVPPNKDVYVFHRKYGMLLTNILLDTDEYVRNIIERIARDIGRRIDTNTPLLDARLPSGDRVNATLQPSSVDGPTLTIRKFRQDPYTMIDLINFGSLSTEIAAFLWVCVEGMHSYPCNLLVSGGTSSGKTTFLNCLSMFLRPTERILTIEDTAELKLPINHWIRLETRPPSIEGTGEISMDVLLKNALRMRPDRIIVGEVRHAEAYTLFTAMNTGHQGSMGTIHANSADETLVRLMSPPMNVPEQMATALNLILILNRIYSPGKGLSRRLTEIAEVSGTKKPELRLIYQWNPTKDRLEPTLIEPQVIKKIANFVGVDKEKIYEEIQIRRNLLDVANKKGISDIEHFSTFVHKYYGIRHESDKED